ncbi:hypothetical protein M911_00380 [Ectothiorhodospira haloalkaliphila]|uniref:Ribosomal protein L7/L12 C-terminal domain-containing protein n=1 Tax=Ectothiorhodospira haloalkaliphila TaxID=421628 RepID=W8KLQ8_9GAMM|nr:hypothetical protein [Ectothiorhodospira haloalkaliphila]AHK77912.1 hypothetical protein M911_00380 [Ectothiorhodospira haloalkaliphila]MCG5496287.1 hypothetical protein [Ectothiorhodospira variabilis]MCG5523790.1 hypothetical protein [Ectothiorhodospira haloalkaliphila]
MGDKAYLVAVTGQLVEGVDPATAQANLARLFRIPEARAAAMLSGKPVVIKKGVDEATARRYQASLREAGVLARLMACAPESGDSPVAGAEPESTPPASSGDPSESPNSPVAQAEPAGPDWTLAPVGTDLSDREAPPPLEVDLSELTLAEPGVTLGTPRDHPPLKVDTSDLTLAQPPDEEDRASTEEPDNPRP